MLAKVVGVSEKKGSYNGIDFHNVIIHTTRASDGCYGVEVCQEKVKFANVPNVFGHSMSAADWQNLIGKDCNFFYNRYGQVDTVLLVEDTKTK